MILTAALRRALKETTRRIRWFERTKEFVSQQPFNGPPRAELIRRFAEIDRHITTAHARGELLFIVEKLLEITTPGPVVECGCFKGGSAAKLSLACKLTGRQLYICDSFEGLPPATEVHYDAKNVESTFETGAYCGTLDEVRQNITRWGAPEVCTFVKGWFSDTLKTLDIQPVLVFMDVDYISSARDCLQALWPKLQPGGYFFSHEMKYKTYVDGITEGEWWHQHLNQCAPVLYGSIRARPMAAVALGYFQKPEPARAQAATS